MVKPGTEIAGQSYPENNPAKTPEGAGQVFAEVYAVAVRSMHPEDAVDVAHDAAVNFLEAIGGTKPSAEYVDEGMRVKVVNVGEIAEAIAPHIIATHTRKMGGDAM